MNIIRLARHRSLECVVSRRDALRERGRSRAEYRTLERELASYDTPSAVDDLLGTLRAAEGADAERVRRIVSGNLDRRGHQTAFSA